MLKVWTHELFVLFAAKRRFSVEAGSGYNPDSGGVAWAGKERCHCCTERVAAFALFVVIFNKLLHSYTCFYCKPVLLVMPRTRGGTEALLGK